MDALIIIGIIVLILLTILMSWQESKMRRVSLVKALLICIFTSPLIAYFILSSYPLRMAKGCKWCGNNENEAFFCGVCGKNEAGEMRPNRVS